MMKNIDVEKIIEAVKSTKAIVLDEKLRTQISMKGEADFVTEVDYQISKYLEKELSKLTPDIGFMSEEEDTQIVPTRWILDPIDGTTNLVYGYNVCSVSLALCVDEVIEFGVVYNPFNGDVFTGYRGKGAFFNGKKLPQIPDRELENCPIGKHVFKNCLDLRRVCSSALSVCYVAQGRLNGYFEKELKPWDYAAAGLILEECGGKMCDWYGDKIRYTAPSGFICGSEKAFDFLKQTIREFDQ